MNICTSFCTNLEYRPVPSWAPLKTKYWFVPHFAQLVILAALTYQYWHSFSDLCSKEQVNISTGFCTSFEHRPVPRWAPSVDEVQCCPTFCIFGIFAALIYQYWLNFSDLCKNWYIISNNIIYSRVLPLKDKLIFVTVFAQI